MLGLTLVKQVCLPNKYFFEAQTTPGWGYLSSCFYSFSQTICHQVRQRVVFDIKRQTTEIYL